MRLPEDTGATGAVLLGLARGSIEYGLEHGTPLPVIPEEFPVALAEPAATFTTLRRAGELRGCCGRLEAARPLASDVAHSAFEAAFRDSRFDPLRRDELAGLDLEVSVLTPMETMRVVDEADLLQQLQRDDVLENPGITRNYLASRLRHYRHEVFACLFLDNRHRVLCFDKLFRGTIDGTSVYPREVVKEALAVNAAAIILAHNHPSGVAEPSQADERITRLLKSALELVDIRLLDHLIIGDGRATSLASRGLL